MHVIQQAYPKASYQSLKTEIDLAIQRVLNSGWYLHGENVTMFEREFAQWLEHDLTMHATAVGSGTAAIEIALRAHNVGPGDEVITTSLLPSPVGQAILATGATPVFIDVHHDFAPRIDQIREMLTRRTKALIAVHLYGIPLQHIHSIGSLALQHGILLIEDCSQAHGATFLDRKVGTFGDVAVFSFYPTKNLAALGDAGAIVTISEAFTGRCRRIREYGWANERSSTRYGVNSRMDEIQAAILRVKLRHLEDETSRRRLVAASYRRVLSRTDFILPPDYAGNVYHQFPLRVNPLFRDELIERIKPHVQTAVHYRVPLHRQPAFMSQCRIPEGGLPITEYLCDALISLPMHRGLCAADVGTVEHYLSAALRDLTEEWMGR